MGKFPPGIQVKMNPDILKEDSRKSNHHFYKRIIEENHIGEVTHLDEAKSTPQDPRYWVKFHYADFLISEKHLTTV
jgi:hypothetical protein